MKKFILVLITLSTFNFTNLNAQWFWQTPYPTGNGIWTVELGNNGEAWIGTYDRIHKTTDYASTWATYIDYGLNNIYSIKMIDDNIGYAVGGESPYNGWILKTTNGGEAWFYQVKNNPNSFFSVAFTDGKQGYACGFHTIAKTSDGGDSWIISTDLNFGILRSLFFISDSIGWCVGYGKIFKTTDAGTTWGQKVSPNADAQAVFFINELIGWMAGSFSYLYYTNDGGETWTPQLIPEMPIIYFVKFINLSEGYICGRYAKIMKTTNGGVSWVENYNGGYQGEDLRDLGINHEWAIAVGNNGSILTTIGSSGSWMERNESIKNFYANSIDFPENEKGFIMGHYSKFMKTVNGGNLWLVDSLHFENQVFNFEKCKFINSSIGLVLANRETISTGVNRIIKTTSGGDNWYTVWQSELYALKDIQFINDSIGFVCGDGVLLKSTDRGESWHQLNSVNPLYSILHFLDENNGFLAGGLNLVSRTTDGGASWSEINIPIGMYHGPINDIFFHDSGLGWSIGYHTMLKTTDSGANWFDVPEYEIFLTNNVINIHFQDEQTGWVLTEEGYNWTTTDMGSSWQEIERIPTQGIINGAYLNKDTIFVVGRSGDNVTILKTTHTNLTLIWDKKLFEVPQRFLVSQNYPNPFNLTTKIKYAIGSQQYAILKVYDILGNEVETLVNEEKSPGTYEVTWDAKDLPSGVYFFQLRVGNFIDSKKMLLLK